MIQITFTPDNDKEGGIVVQAVAFVDCVTDFLGHFQLVYGPFDDVDALVPLFKTLAEAAEKFGEDDIHSDAHYHELENTDNNFTLSIDKIVQEVPGGG